MLARVLISSEHRGYHTIVSSFQKVFHLERRWKLVRELGSGAYGVVMYVHSSTRRHGLILVLIYSSSAADEISGETVAIKLVTRVFEKIQFAKRALREITLLRHFSHHGNITGLIDVDAISADFSEMYAFCSYVTHCLIFIIAIYSWRYGAEQHTLLDQDMTRSFPTAYGR